MEQEKGCEAMEVNSKTKIGLTPKELIWIITLVVGIGYAWADIKSDMTDFRTRLSEFEQRQSIYDIELKNRNEIDSKNYREILLQLETLRGDLKLKQDRYN